MNKTYRVGDRTFDDIAEATAYALETGIVKVEEVTADPKAA